MILTDSDIVPMCVIKPGGFGALMALYEANFIKLSRLAPRLAERSGDYLSSSRTDCNLQLKVEEQSRYTRAIRLSYLFEEASSVVADPDLDLRVYLDARLVEVKGWATHHRHIVLNRMTREVRGEVDRRWSYNVVLSKWLDYLLEMDHCLKPCRARDIERPA